MLIKVFFPRQNLIAVFTGWDVLNGGTDVNLLVPRLLKAVRTTECPGNEIVEPTATRSKQRQRVQGRSYKPVRGNAPAQNRGLVRIDHRHLPDDEWGKLWGASICLTYSLQRKILKGGLRFP
jgi:hypothetical protein